MKKCVFSGSFDPPTAGHKNIIDGCLKIFDEVVVAIMINPDKKPYLTEDERERLLKKLYDGEKRVKVITFHGAAADLLESENTPFYVRGVRDGIDLDYENRNLYATKKLKKDIVTIYLPAEQEMRHISSSLIRNSEAFNKEYSEYIPEAIKEEYYNIIRKEKRDV